MTAKKQFDCVQMKREIQDRITKDVVNLKAEERRQRMGEVIKRDPRIERIWRSGRRRGQAA